MDNLDQTDYYCSAPWLEVLIRESGDVYFCCHMQESLGNLVQQDMFDIWNGDLAQAIRKSITNYEVHPVCSHPSCPFVAAYRHKYYNPEDMC